MLEQTHWLYRFAIMAGILLTTSLMSAQRTNTPLGDSLNFSNRVVKLLSEDIGSEATSFAQEYGLLDSINLTEIIPFLGLNNEEADTIDNKIKSIEFKGGYVGIQNTYSDLGADESRYNQSSLYTNVSSAASISVLEVPLNFSSRVIFNSGAFNSQLSNFRIDYNPAAFLEQQKRKVLNAKGGRLLNMATPDGVKENLKRRTQQLSIKEKETLLKEVKFQVLQSIVTSPKYAEMLSEGDKERSKILGAKDSIDMLRDSAIIKYHLIQDSISVINKEIRNAKQKIKNIDQNTIVQYAQDSLVQNKKGILDSLQILINRGEVVHRRLRSYNKEEISQQIQDSLDQRLVQVDSIKQYVRSIQTKYQESWDERKTYYGDSLNTIKNKVNQYLDVDPQQESKLLRDELIHTDSIPLLLKLASLTKKFEIGQSAVNGDWYTIQNLPIKGFQYGGGLGDWEANVAFGAQVYNTAFTTIWNADLFTKAKGATVNYGSITYTPDSTLSLSASYLKMNSQGFTDGPFLELPFDNDVLSFRSKFNITKNLYFSTSFNFSKEAGQSIVENPVPALEDKTGFAGEVTLGGEVMKGVTSNVGYYQVDQEFSSRGNPFIQPNRQGLVFKLKGDIAGKIDFGVDLKYGVSIDTSALVADNQKNVEALGYLNYTINPNWLISAQVSPNTFKYYGSGDINYTGSNSIYNFQVSNQQEFGAIQSITTAGFTNFNSEIAYVDTSVTNISDQVFIQNSLQLSTRSSISSLLMYGINSGNNLEGSPDAMRSSFIQMDYGYQTENIGLTIGGQYLRNYVSEGTLLGVTNSLTWRLTDHLGLDTNINYQFSLTDSNENRIWASLGLKMEFK